MLMIFKNVIIFIQELIDKVQICFDKVKKTTDNTLINNCLNKLACVFSYYF